MKIRTLAVALAAVTAGVAAVAAAAVSLGRRRPGDREGHPAPDLAADAVPGERAPPAFRPDMDAPMTAAEREALRPPTGPSPTLVDTGTSQPV